MRGSESEGQERESEKPEPSAKLKVHRKTLGSGPGLRTYAEGT
jgi:hypothetical protein